MHKTFLVKLRDRLLFIFVFFASFFVFGQEPIPFPASNPVRSKPHEHSAIQDAESIKAHHMLRLDAKLASNEESEKSQKESCRYESAIATSPPPKRVVLTFDDGPEPGQTEQILAVLRKHHVPAAFFMVGEKAQLHPELALSVHGERIHLIGNHSWSHPNFHAISTEQQRQEVMEAESALSHVLTKRLFRYPFGNSTCPGNNFLKTEGYTVVGWHIDSCDWAFDRTGKVTAREALECGVLRQYENDFVEHVVSAVRAHNGGIVLMHEIHANTVRQLDNVIQRLKSEGFSFSSLDDESFKTSLVRP